nr:probable peptide/nitrate transporter At3g43790 [Hydra vulgaris]
MFKKHWMLLRTSSFVTLLRNKYFLLSATLYGMYTFCLSGFDELFSLFASTSIEYGGLGMSTSEIGILYLIISIGTLVVQFIIVSRVIIKFGSKKIFIGASLLSGVLIPFIPLYSNIKNKAALWTIMWIHQMFIRAGLITGYTTVNIFINNSVGSDLLGVANGVGLSLACIGRYALTIILYAH